MPEPSGSMPDPDPIEEMGDFLSGSAPKNIRGCAPILIIAVVLIGAILSILGFTRGDDDSGDSKSGAPSPSASAPAPSTPSESASGSESPSESPSESDSQPATGGTYTPPAEADLPAGAVLYQGSSGKNIGCITCDGQSRFLHIQRSGVGVGDAARTAQEVVWKQNGAFVEFGANISGRNRGRYGYNLFANGSQYMTGCAMEIGQTSCRQQTTSPVKKGDRITIIIGEGGTMVNGQVASRGDFVVNWWFVFQPAS